MVLREYQSAICGILYAIDWIWSISDEFLTFEELKLRRPPLLVSGKIDRNRLTHMVREHQTKPVNATVNGDDDNNTTAEIQTKMLSIWSGLLGVPQQQIDVQTDISEYSDSINLMSYRDKLKKATGLSLSSEEALANKTIIKQAALLGDREEGPTPEIKTQLQRQVATRQGPPTAPDMIHTLEDPTLLQMTKEHVQEVVRPWELDWDDVEDVIRGTDLASESTFDISAKFKVLTDILWPST